MWTWPQHTLPLLLSRLSIRTASPCRKIRLAGLHRIAAIRMLHTKWRLNRELGVGTLLTDFLECYLTKADWDAVQRRTNSYFDQHAKFCADLDTAHAGWRIAANPAHAAAHMAAQASLTAEIARLDAAYPIRPFNARAGTISETWFDQMDFAVAPILLTYYTARPLFRSQSCKCGTDWFHSAFDRSVGRRCHTSSLR